jgi:hypothetical protein
MLSKGFKPNTLVTMNGKRYCSLKEVSDAFKHMINVVQRHLYGRHSKQKIKFLAIAEKNEANQSHFHALFDIPLIEENRYMLEFLQTWTVLDKGSSIGLSNDTLTARDTWFKQVYEVEGVVKYLFKNHRNAEKYEFVGMVL